MKPSTPSVIGHPVENRVVPQRRTDGYVNATALCKAAGKRFHDYSRLETTTDFLDDLSLDAGIPVSKLTEHFRGRPSHLQGTWVHPRVAIDLASSLSVKFRVLVTKWVLEWERDRAYHSAHVASKLRLYLSPEKRAWTKTFPDVFWIEIARLTGHTGSIHKRPQWWGHLVNTLIYDCLDPDVGIYLRENMPKPRRGQNYHQWLTSEHGLPKLNDHIQQVIGIAKTCGTITQLQEKMARIFSDQLALGLVVRDVTPALWDPESVH